jgi:hypothetical protein
MHRVRWLAMRLLTLRVGVMASLLLVARPAAAEPPACKERCQVERDRVQKQLEECLRQVDPRPSDRAAKMRLLCRERHSPPRCDERPPCPKEKKAPPAAPGMTLGPMVFSAAKRGPALAHPTYAPGEEVFLRVAVEVRPRPEARRVFLRMDLRLLAVVPGHKGSRLVARWDGYAEEQRMLDPAERGLPLRFTLHGGAKLPPDVDPGSYRLEADIAEQTSKFKQSVGGGFEVKRRAP